MSASARLLTAFFVSALSLSPVQNTHAQDHDHGDGDHAHTWKVSKNYAEVREFMNHVADHHPENAKVFTLGISDSGVPIEGLQIGHGPVNHLIVAAHHGNEYGSTEVAKAFAHSLAEQPLEGMTVYVIPVLNTWGFDRRSRHERTMSGKSVDPNRDYPGPCGTKGPFYLKSTQALADFVGANNIVATATLHTYWPAVVYPWGFATPNLETGYEDIFVALAEAATQHSHYTVGNATKVIYPAEGTYEDWAFWAHGSWSLLFEVGQSHYPNQKAIEEMIFSNVPGLRAMLEEAPKERAEQHAFTGTCNRVLFDPAIE